MDTLVFVAVLGAAAFHAGWNSLIKGGGDRAASAVVQMTMQTALVIPLLPFIAIPARISWSWLAASVLLHVAYKLFLIRSYAHSDLSQSYPLARGAAPPLVALYSALILGVELTGVEIAAIALVSGGVLAMAFLGSGAGRMRGAALFYALGTAAFTAAYTLVDGTGARLSGTPTGYIVWMTIWDALLLNAVFRISRGIAITSFLSGLWRTGLVAGAMSLASYWIAVWAFTRAPIALVAALRESSILFAVVIAAAFMGERVNAWRWISALVIAAGVALMKI